METDGVDLGLFLETCAILEMTCLDEAKLLKMVCSAACGFLEDLGIGFARRRWGSRADVL
jgi:hypothetical protein